MPRQRGTDERAGGAVCKEHEGVDTGSAKALELEIPLVEKAMKAAIDHQ